MKLIDDFESADEQNVRTFNKIFKMTPIVDVTEDTPVIIMEPANADMRWVRIGGTFVRVDLTLSTKITHDAPQQVGITVDKEKQRRERKAHKRTEFVEPYKTCSKCNQYLHFDNFSNHRYSKGGVRSACKKCCAKQVKEIVKRRNLNG